MSYKNLLMIEENLGHILNRITFIYRNQKILTECIKNFKGFSIFKEKVGPFQKGKNYKIKLFIAIPLIKRDILKIAFEERFEINDVQRYAIIERDDLKLKELDNKYFLDKIKEFRRFMKKAVLSGKKAKIDLDRYNSYNTNLVDSRLQKLLRLGISDLSPLDEKLLTNSELLFVRKISEWINIWRTHYLNQD